MSDKNGTAAGGGISFLGALTVLFVGLKLAHIIDWPWFWVLSPFLIPVLLCAAIVVCAIIYALIKTFSKG